MHLKGKVLVIALVAATMLVIAQPGQLAASTATLNWQVSFTDNEAANKLPIRALAVDQSSGNIYIARAKDVTNTIGVIERYDKEGNLIQTIGPIVNDGTGVKKLTIGTGAGTYVTGLAVDPITGFLYVMVGSTIHVLYVLPPEYGIDPTWMTSFKGTPYATGGVYGGNIAISDDGQYIYCYATFTNVAPIEKGIRQFRHIDNGTPFDMTDDTFTPIDDKRLDNVGLLPATSVSDPRGCTVDRNGRVYMSDISSTKRPIRRYVAAGSDTLDMEFYYATTRTWGCATDTNNNFWAGDYESVATHLVHCYSEGQEIFNFDPMSNGGNIANPMMVAFDRTNGRVIVAGCNGTTTGTVTATSSSLQSWSISLDSTPSTGTIACQVIDSVTGNPITNLTSLSAYSPYGSAGLARFNVDGDGTYSITVNPGLYNVKAQAAGYLSAAVSHYTVTASSTTTTADIPLLPAASDYVTISLGEHNVEQGLFLMSTDPTQTATQDYNWRANIATTMGGRQCRAFGPIGGATNMKYMGFDIDSGFINDATGGVPVWIEADLYDVGYDRWNAQFDTAASSVTSMGYPSKTSTSTWQTFKWARPDARCRSAMPGGIDLRFDSMLYDASANIDYFSKVTIRKNATANSYDPADTILSLKSNNRPLGTSWVNAGAANAGGYAVKITGKVVAAGPFTTPQGNKFYYITEPDGSCGIRLMTNNDYSPEVGDIVDVTGSIMAVPECQEIALLAARPPVVGIDVKGQVTNPIKPVGMGAKSVGGRELGYLYAAGSSTYYFGCQPGVPKSISPSNIAMPGKVWGKVTAVGANAANQPYAYVDDGSAVRGEGVVGSTDKVGVKIMGTDAIASSISSLQVGQYITATGAISMGLFDPTPPTTPTDDASRQNGDDWRYPMLWANEVTVVH